MPFKELGSFLNSKPGFLAICAVIMALLLVGRAILKKCISKEYLGQALVLLSLGLIAAMLLLLTIWFPVRGEVSAAVVPRLWIVAIFACLIYLFVLIVKKTEKPDQDRGDIVLTAKFMAATAAYIVLMFLVGYYIASIIFLVVAMALLSYRRRIVTMSLGIGWMVFSYLVFYKLLYVPLPQGLLINALFG
ncbi:MAG: tripartite tricarboxylate transporter TctB family protein [Spirochaetia bacterium]|jgi:hypothetical protein|nr:tripartite tricarboxylate transporter TctB family protein [Spirochaetia bacterium]